MFKDTDEKAGAMSLFAANFAIDLTNDLAKAGVIRENDGGVVESVIRRHVRLAEETERQLKAKERTDASSIPRTG